MRVAAEGHEGHSWLRHFWWWFFPKTLQAGRDLKLCSEVLFQSKVWAYLFHGEFILTALMHGHEKNVPLKSIFQMCFLVAVVTLEVYSDPLSSVMLCQKMQATCLIGLKELLCKMANLMAHSSEYWMGHIYMQFKTLCLEKYVFVSYMNYCNKSWICSKEHLVVLILPPPAKGQYKMLSTTSAFLWGWEWDFNYTLLEG